MPEEDSTTEILNYRERKIQLEQQRQAAHLQMLRDQMNTEISNLNLSHKTHLDPKSSASDLGIAEKIALATKLTSPFASTLITWVYIKPRAWLIRRRARRTEDLHADKAKVLSKQSKVKMPDLPNHPPGLFGRLGEYFFPNEDFAGFKPPLANYIKVGLLIGGIISTLVIFLLIFASLCTSIIAQLLTGFSMNCSI